MLPAILNIHPPTVTADNTPDAVNWGDIYWDVSDSTGIVTSRQITGISSSINLYVENPWKTYVTLWYQVTGSQITANITSLPSSPWVEIGSAGAGATITVNNNEWVTFACHGGSDSKTPEAITVLNASDSNAQLDTFTIDSQP